MSLFLCLALQRAYASVQLKLDDELGTHHGISFNDFALRLSGRALLHGAVETASSICAEAAAPISANALQVTSTSLVWIAGI